MGKRYNSERELIERKVSEYNFWADIANSLYQTSPETSRIARVEARKINSELRELSKGGVK